MKKQQGILRFSSKKAMGKSAGFAGWIFPWQIFLTVSGPGRQTMTGFRAGFCEPIWRIRFPDRFCRTESEIPILLTGSHDRIA